MSNLPQSPTPPPPVSKRNQLWTRLSLILAASGIICIFLWQEANLVDSHTSLLSPGSVDQSPREEDQPELNPKHGLLFGQRQGHRLAHMQARATPASELGEFLEFNQSLILPEFRDLPMMEVEAEYFRFRDRFGLIDTGFTDEQILQALQRLVDIYAKANVRIRIRPKEALSFVDLSDERAKAYWYYVDYPKGDLLSKERRERKELMTKVIGKRLISLFDRVYFKDRNGLLDWITGFPNERTRWEQRNVVGIFPVYFFYYMNGAGETNCMRFRAGDCSKPKLVQSIQEFTPNETVQTMCYHMEVGTINSAHRTTKERPVVRKWEKFEFNLDMAIRLIAHEFGHALKLQHVTGKACIPLKTWSDGNLMNQVRQMALEGTECNGVGWPWKTVEATKLLAWQCHAIRRNLYADLRPTPIATGELRVGKSIEVLGRRTLAGNRVGKEEIYAFVGQHIIDWSGQGRLKRVSWKSGSRLTKPIRISVGGFEGEKGWVEAASMVVNPHQLGAHLHQEHVVDLPLAVGQLVALFGEEDLQPDSHTHDNAGELLIKDQAWELHKREMVHETVDQVLNRADLGRILPKRAPLHKNVFVQTQSNALPSQWDTVVSTEWMLMLDVVTQG
ncbi:hypothetical protein BASA81_007890 [Batrachochytrium salamandrivorans]|nr:hypothetical protein BASA81_007890 [Batrachochytrium salamandrivorans]